MLQLDIITLVQLTKLFVREMVERDYGYVLHVASLAAFQPSPTYATYAAAKAFVLNFGEAVAYELRHTRVRMTVLSPGAVATEFLQVSGQKQLLAHRLSMTSSPAVTEAGVQGDASGRSSLVTGLVNVLAGAFGALHTPPPVRGDGRPDDAGALLNLAGKGRSPGRVVTLDWAGATGSMEDLTCRETF